MFVIYQKEFRGFQVRSDLISGYITAIMGFGDQVRVDGVPLRKIQFQDLEIVFEISDKFLVALIIEGVESAWISDKLKRFIVEIEKTFGKKIEDWAGDLSNFNGIEELANEIFGLNRL